MKAGSMVTPPTPAHTFTSIRRNPSAPAAQRRRTDMQQDIRADSPPADTQQRGADLAPADADPGIIEELLVEEVSIDGMCGVY
jgi:mycofactocin precursor